MYGGLIEKPLEVKITKNAVESFSDGFYPIVVVSARTKEPSIIHVQLYSSVYETLQSSGDYVTEYASLVILPTNTFSTDFSVTVDAYDKGGVRQTRHISLTTKEEPEVLFMVN
jgi:hypothetical protein